MKGLAFAFFLLCLGCVAQAQKAPAKPPTTTNKQLVETRGENKVPGGKPLYAVSHALIIGINKYPNLPPQNQLSFAVRDATALKDVLVKNYGFEADKVVLLTDAKATLGNIRDVLSAFADNNKVGKDDRILIYFSGHGQTVPTPDGGEMGYLIPSDAKVDLTNPNNSAPYLSTCLPMRQIWDYLGASPAKHALVIADACFSGLLARMRGGLSKQAAAVLLARKARMVLTGGSKGEQTSERSDLGHGVFTAKLIDELTSRAATPGNVFTVSDLYSSLQSDVASATNGKQNPQIGSFEADGDVLFVSGGFAPPSTFGDRGAAEAVTMSVASDPPGAEVWIDGVDSGKVTPCDVPVLFPNNAKTAQVKLVLVGFDPSVFTVNNTGTNIQLQGTLAASLGGGPAAGTATVHVKSEPVGAEILLNGNPTGKVTPADLTVPASADGSLAMLISFHLEGHPNRTVRIHPVAGKEVDAATDFNAVGKSSTTLLKADPKLKGPSKNIATDIQTILEKLGTDFISRGQAEKNGKSTYRNEDDGTREYVREFDPMKQGDIADVTHNYMVAFRSGLADWKQVKNDADEDRIVAIVTYQSGLFEVKLETTRSQQGSDLQDRAVSATGSILDKGRLHGLGDVFKTGPQTRWTLRLTITRRPKPPG